MKSIKAEAWGVKNKNTGMIIPRTYPNKRQAELLIRNVEDVMDVIPVMITERKPWKLSK